jgi:hypothetical protein
MIVLAAGSTLATELREVTTDEAVVGSDPQAFAAETIWDGLRLPHDKIRGTVLRPPWHDRGREELLDAVVQSQANEYSFWLDNGDRFAGLIVRVGLEGGSPAWELRTAVGEVTIPHEKLIAVAWPSAASPSAAASARAGVLGLRDGSRLFVQRIGVQGDRVQLQLVDGVTLSLAAEALWAQVGYVRPPNDAVVFASDLEPLGYRHVPFLNVPWTYGTDRNALGSRLRCGESWYEKGLGVHSTSRLAYQVPPSAERFQAEIALDTSAGDRGSVIFRVYLQPDAGEWQQAFESPIVRGNEQPRNVDIDVRRARRLALIVEFADRGDEMDRGNWLMARFVTTGPAE